jgi:hypothetical protein
LFLRRHHHTLKQFHIFPQVSIFLPDTERSNNERIYGTMVGQLIAGDAFGITSMQSDDGTPPNATIIAQSNVEILVVEKDVYEREMGTNTNIVANAESCQRALEVHPSDRKAYHINLLLDFVKPLPFFQQLPDSARKALCAAMQVQ